jgi:hypothetical protein
LAGKQWGSHLIIINIILKRGGKMEKTQPAEKKKELYEDPQVLATYTNEELEEMIKPHGEVEGGGCGCGGGSILI